MNHRLRSARSSHALAGALAVALLGSFTHAEDKGPPLVTAPRPADSSTRPFPRATAWSASGQRAIRGITVGPIENALHPNKGYGTPAFERTLDELARLGAGWVSLTPFGRLYDKRSTTVALDFEQPFADNAAALERAVRQAHARGLKVMLVPHLWVESGEWRGELDPGTDAGWDALAQSYRRFLLAWANVAGRSKVDLLAVGIELRSWVTTPRARSFRPLIADVRKVYTGPLTYAANWDDVGLTAFVGELDLIGLNAFYPLAEKEGASLSALHAAARARIPELSRLAAMHGKPVLFTELGYTTRTDPSLRPWEWPEHLANVQVDQRAQAEALLALLGAFVDEPWFAGAFLWRYYADPDDVSQEPEWGFSPRGKQAELVLADAFRGRWGADGKRPRGAPFLSRPATSLLAP